MCALTLVLATCRKGGGIQLATKSYYSEKSSLYVTWSIHHSSNRPFPLLFMHRSSNHSSIPLSLKPINSGKDGLLCFIDVYFMYVLWACIVQKKLCPRPPSSAHLWIRPFSHPLIHAIIPSSFHPSIPQLYIFKFLQK